MTMSKIWSVLLSVVLLVFAVAYSGKLPMILLSTLYIVGILTAVWSFAAKKKIRVSIHAGEVDGEGNVAYRIKANNASFFPVTFCEAVLRCENQFDGRSIRQKIHFTIPPRGEQIMSGMLHAGHAGAYDLVCEKLFFTDWFKLFKRRLSLPENERFHVWPHCYSLDASLVSIPEEDPSSNLISPDKAGSVPGDFFGVRGYREGDRLQYVHWKLTGKTGDFVVKEFSLPQKYAISVLLEFSHADDARMKDALLDAAATLCGLFLEKHVEHELCFLQDGRMLRYPIAESEGLYEALREVLSRPPVSDPGLKALTAMEGDVGKKHLICVTADREAANHELLHSQSVSSALVLAAWEELPSHTDDRFRVIPVDAAHVRSSLMGLEL